MSEFLARGAMGEILEGQTAIVTGAGSADGIGFAIARRLLRDGAQIAITSTTERIHERARELDASGKNAVAGVVVVHPGRRAHREVPLRNERSRRYRPRVRKQARGAAGPPAHG